MTLSAPSPEMTTRAGAERAAWAEYSESVRDLEGREYEEAERASWERLQRRLRDIHANDAIHHAPGLRPQG